MQNKRRLKSQVVKNKLQKVSKTRLIIGVLAIGLLSVSIANYSNSKKVLRLRSERLDLEGKIERRDKSIKILEGDNGILQENVRAKIQELKSKNDEIDSLKTKLEEEKAKREERVTPSRSGQTVSKQGDWIVMNASAYTNAPEENGGYSTTALGDPLIFGMVAIDPSFIPLGTKIQIEGYGDMVFKCSDTGGAIKGNRIDILLNSKAEAMKFGRRQVRVRIVK